MSDMFEIESSKLAVERADAPTKTFAQQMVADHQKTTDEMKQLVEGGKVKAALPTSMSKVAESGEGGILRIDCGEPEEGLEKKTFSRFLTNVSGLFSIRTSLPMEK